MAVRIMRNFRFPGGKNKAVELFPCQIKLICGKTVIAAQFRHADFPARYGVIQEKDSVQKGILLTEGQLQRRYLNPVCGSHLGSHIMRFPFDADRTGQQARPVGKAQPGIIDIGIFTENIRQGKRFPV